MRKLNTRKTPKNRLQIRTRGLTVLPWFKFQELQDWAIQLTWLMLMKRNIQRFKSKSLWFTASPCKQRLQKFKIFQRSVSLAKREAMDQLGANLQLPPTKPTLLRWAFLRRSLEITNDLLWNLKKERRHRDKSSKLLDQCNVVEQPWNLQRCKWCLDHLQKLQQIVLNSKSKAPSFLTRPPSRSVHPS